MTVHDWYAENLSAYVTRDLGPREERLYADHVTRCDECAREVALLERDLAWLPMAVRPAMPRPGLTRQLADGVFRRRPLWRRLAAQRVIQEDIAVDGHRGGLWWRCRRPRDPSWAWRSRSSPW